MTGTSLADGLRRATDDELATALRDAELPSLMPALAYLTGDMSLVAGELRPASAGPAVVLAPQGGMTPAQQALARQRALDVLIAFRDGGCVPAAPPSRLADQRALMTFMTGGVDDRYLPMLAFELGLPGDSDAPGWTKAQLAPERDFRVAIIGAGMSGLAVAYRLLQARIDFVVFERHDDAGGVWLENDYPGCRLDTSNFCYSYSFLQRDDWPHQYSRGPDIREYFQDASRELGLRKYIRFGTTVRAARYDEASGEWLVAVDRDSEVMRFSAVISAVGQLNTPSLPAIDGAGDFAGASFHSARWDRAADLRGKRVGVIGSGASGYQVVPSIAGEVGEMRLFMRNPPWTIPTPNYHAMLPPGLAWLFRTVPYYHRWFRFYQFWTSVEGRRDFATVDPGWREPGSVSAKNQRLRETLTRRLMAEYEGRPDLQRVMIPRHPPYGKRMLRDNGAWARALKQPNVTVVTDRIERITPAGIVTADGIQHELDVIVWCTGFQAWRFLGGIEVTGTGGVDLHQRWGQDPSAYLGITVPGFPNLFCLYGPNTNLVVNGSIVMFSECAVHYVMECLRMLLGRGDQVMDLRPEVLESYQATIDGANALMAWGVEGVDNWYKSPTGRVSQNWPLATIEYWDLTRAPDPDHYTIKSILFIIVNLFVRVWPWPAVAAYDWEVRLGAEREPAGRGAHVALSGEYATVQQLMDAAAGAFGNREAYVEGGQRVTFGEWLARADLLAAELARRGVRRGDVVALMLPPSVDYAVCYAAAAKAGAITTGLNTRLGRREADAILGQCSPALVVRDESLRLPDMPAGTAVLARSELAAICRGPAGGTLVETAREALAPVRAACAPDDIVTIMWTSGTTGLPKGACFDHWNLRAISDAAGAICAPGDRRLGATPFAHAGYMGRLWDQLHKGMTLVICPPGLPPQDMVRLVADERITVFGAVPTQWERLLRLPGIGSADLSRVRVGTSATAPARPELVREITERLGFPLVVRYAMTESPTICGTEPQDPPDVQFRTVGRPQRGMEVSVAAPPGEVGQVRIRGGCVMRGYWNAPGLTRKAFDADGWLVSGDLGYLREDGNLALVGRATDMYIRGGYNVYPAEVEAVLALHPAVASVSVIGTPAPRIGEIGVAFVVPAVPQAPPSLEELREIVQAELADYKAPDRLEIVGQLPVNAMMKVDKNALRELAGQPGGAA